LTEGVIEPALDDGFENSGELSVFDGSVIGYSAHLFLGRSLGYFPNQIQATLHGSRVMIYMTYGLR
jgi:hypothetical protein